MPVKRRTDKRRLGPTAELKAWSGAFQSLVTFFGELEEIGVATDRLGRLGARFLVEEADPVLGTPWALGEFGEPLAA